MNVAELRDLHPVQSVWKFRDRNLNAPDLIVQSLGSETIHRAEKRSRTRNRGCGFEKMPPARIGEDFSAANGCLLPCRFFCSFSLPYGVRRPAPGKLNAAHELYAKESKKCTRKPHSHKQRKNLPARNPVIPPHAEAVRQRQCADHGY